ncbi:MAG TPA: hypothetical protein VGA78_05455 [Gemmatimonadales bacterium]
MLLSTLGFLAVLQTSDSAGRPIPPDSYANPATAQLVANARAARDRNERLVTSYTATVKQRLGVGIRALSRDRMLYRQELVARIAWKRDAPSTVEIVGAREGIPIALRGDRLPEDLDAQATSLVLNPAEDYIRLIGGDDDEGLMYPLRQGGEFDYRFEAGDTTTISLPTGRQIRLLALKVIPRRADWQLMSGTLWFDGDTHGLVQAVFRPARPFEFRRDVDPDDREDVPGFVNPVAEVKYITLEYGLYEGRWWLPRYMALDAAGKMGSWLGVPVRLERVYEDYEVEGGTPPVPGSTFRPAGTVRRRERYDDTPADSTERRRVADSTSAAVKECIDRETRRLNSEGWKGRAYRQELRRCWRRPSDSSLVVIVPADTAALLVSPELGEPILQMGDLISEAEIRSLSGAIGDLPGTPWGARVQLPSGVGALLQHARYNRIEALSLGVSGTLDLGPAAVRGTARLGVADLVPNADLSLLRTTSSARLGLTAYRRLATANPDARPFGPINSVLGFLAQRDDGEYYRTLGLELTAQNTNSGWINARVFLQRERPAEVETNASLPHLFDKSNLFRSNFVADSATQLGGSVTVRGSRALSHAVALGGETTVDGATGDFDFGRAAGTVRLFVTPSGPLAGAVSVSAGTSTGTVSNQGRFFLGGPGTLRGYSGGVLAGPAFWSARAEVGNSFPAARVTVFGDAGWAGERSQFSTGRPLIGAGVGASFLDGLVRFDLARGLRDPKGWRLEIYVDGIL